jgi:hypothetical protein
MIISDGNKPVNTPKRDYLQEFVDRHLIEVDEHPPVWMVAPESPAYLDDAPDPLSPTAAQIAAELRTALHAIDFADHVGRTSAAYRTNEVDRIVADHALAIFQDANVFRKRISAVELSARTGLSRPTCRDAMQRLSWLLSEVDEPQRRKTDTPLYCIDVDNLPRALLCILHDLCRVTRGDITLHLAAHAGQDALVRSLSKLTPDELKRRNAARALAGLPDAPGRGVMLLVDALLRYGSMTRSELETVLFKRRGAVYRMIKKAHAARIVTVEDGSISLVEDWALRVERLNGLAPTKGTTAKRKRQAIESKFSYLERAINDPRCTPAQVQRLGQRLAQLREEAYALMQPEIDAFNARRAAAGIAPVDIEITMQAGPDFWTLRTQKTAKTLSGEIEGLTRDQAFFYGAQAGYTMAEIDLAWNICRGLA